MSGKNAPTTWSRVALLSAITVAGSMAFAAILWPGFRDAVGPRAEWAVGGSSYGFPVPLVFYFLLLAVPGIIGGLLGSRIADSGLSRASTLVGVGIGCLWDIHLSFLLARVTRASMIGDGRLVGVERVSGQTPIRWFINAEYDLLMNSGALFRILGLLLPGICAVVAVLTINYWIRWQRRGPGEV